MLIPLGIMSQGGLTDNYFATTQGSGSVRGIAYVWNANGTIGSQYSAPAEPSANAGNHSNYSEDGKLLSMGNQNAFGIWNFSKSGWGSKFANPTGYPTTGSEARGTAITKAKNAFVAASGDASWLHGYPLSGSGYGTKFANPSSYTPMQGFTSASFHPSGNAVIVYGDTSSYSTQYVSTRAWAFSSSTGWGSQIGSVLLKEQTKSGSRFSKNGNIVFAITGTNSRLYAWDWSGSFGTQYSAASGSQPAFVPNAAAISTNDRYVFTTGSGTPYYSCTIWNGTGWGVKLANGPGYSYNRPRSAIGVSPTGKHVVIGGQSLNNPYTDRLFSIGFNGDAGWGSVTSYAATPPNSDPYGHMSFR
jgi:hypothetical protein